MIEAPEVEPRSRWQALAPAEAAPAAERRIAGEAARVLRAAIADPSTMGAKSVARIVVKAEWLDTPSRFVTPSQPSGPSP